MRKHQTKRNKKYMKGGFLENLSDTLTDWGNSLTNSTSELFQKKDQSPSSQQSTYQTSSYQQTPDQTQQSTYQTPTYQQLSYQTPSYQQPYGGKHTKRRKLKGGGTVYSQKPKYKSYSGKTKKHRKHHK